MARAYRKHREQHEQPRRVDCAAATAAPRRRVGRRRRRSGQRERPRGRRGRRIGRRAGYAQRAVRIVVYPGLVVGFPLDPCVEVVGVVPRVTSETFDRDRETRSGCEPCERAIELIVRGNRARRALAHDVGERDGRGIEKPQRNAVHGIRPVVAADERDLDGVALDGRGRRTHLEREIGDGRGDRERGVAPGGPVELRFRSRHFECHRAADRAPGRQAQRRGPYL